MNGVYLPTFLANNTWPESVKKEFSGQLHKFMASLTGHHWTTHGIIDVVLVVVLGLIFMNTNLLGDWLRVKFDPQLRQL